jgi:hypothetical protein
VNEEAKADYGVIMPREKKSHSHPQARPQNGLLHSGNKIISFKILFLSTYWNNEATVAMGSNDREAHHAALPSAGQCNSMSQVNDLYKRSRMSGGITAQNVAYGE